MNDVWPFILESIDDKLMWFVAVTIKTLLKLCGRRLDYIKGDLQIRHLGDITAACRFSAELHVRVTNSSLYHGKS